MAAGAPPPDIEVERPLSPPPFDVNSLSRFLDPLPIPSIARARGVGEIPGEKGRTAPLYRIEMRELLNTVHRAMPATRMWGYEGAMPGPTFEVPAGQDTLIEWVNQLPTEHMLAVDTNLHGAEEDKPKVRTVVHVHGARVTPQNDGFPTDWFTRGGSAVYHYPNRQDGATLWYHDHALGITRLNIFAGLFGAFIIRDEAEEALHLPKGKYEIPLIICDRSFDSNGQLDYPINPLYKAPWVPEFSGNAILVNGKLFPYLSVEARRYRFRIINVSNGRVLNLSIAPQHPIAQIGGDQGLLAGPAELREIRLAPAERAEVVIDFRDAAGTQLILKNDESEILQFRVSPEKIEDASAVPRALRKIERIPLSSVALTRTLTLDEYLDPMGRVMRSLLNGARWSAPVTETPVLGTSEVWELVNLTKDPHPIHLHGVRFQVIDRRPFDVGAYQRTHKVTYAGAAAPAEVNEMGWKDTVRSDPAMVTRIIVPFEAFAGRYSWHCHNLEHEDNEMMRPLEIQERSSGHSKSTRRHSG
jgi:spore coat protein A